jgi:hypothetical protein
MMTYKGALEAVRDARKKISREHGNDPKKLVEHYLEYQKELGDSVIWFVPPEADDEATKEDQAA